MGKKKKTLRQKKLADKRLLTEFHGQIGQAETQEHTPTTTSTFSYTFAKTKETSTRTHIYSLGHDLRKTLLVSLGILLFLILFSTLLHKYSLVLPLVSVRY